MKHLKKNLTKLALLTLLAMLPQLAGAFNVDGINYNINDDGNSVTVTGHSEDLPSDLVIPESVTYNGKTYAVTTVYGGSFIDCQLNSVVWNARNCNIFDDGTSGSNGSGQGNDGFYTESYYYHHYFNPFCHEYHFEYHYYVDISDENDEFPIWIEDESRSYSENNYDSNTSINSFTFGKDVESIPARLCEGLEGLTEIYCYIPEPLTINENVFSNYNIDLYVPAASVSKYQTTYPWSKFNVIAAPPQPTQGLAYEYHNDGTAAVTGYTSDLPSDLVIPESVFFNGNTYSVTSIGGGAFSGCRGLTSVTIPNSVTTIGCEAFEGCNGLNRVNINNLESWCKIIFEFELYAPDYIRMSSNPLIYAHNLYLNGSMITDLVIPNSIIDIGNCVFAGCSGLTSVSIPNSVKSIGHYAFDGCTNLTKVDISDIAAWCNIDFANNFLIYGNYNDNSSNPLFYAHHLYLNGSELTDLVIPDTISTIKKNTFFNCHSLTSVTIPNSVETIGEKAFYNCSSLTSVTLPDSLSSVGAGAFINCPLNSVIWNAKECNVLSLIDYYWSELGVCYFNPFGAYEYHFDNIITNFNNSINSFSFGRNVETISSNLCRGLKGLTTLTIPNSVKSIGKYAFADCSGLESVYSRIRDPQNVDCGSGIFCNLNYVYDDEGGDFAIDIYDGELLGFDLYVPHGKREVYEQTSPWSNFNIIEMDATGDVNDDGSVNVTDYVKTASYILEMDPQPFYFEECDFDDNGTITVGDLVGVATRVLSFEEAPMLAPVVGMTTPSLAMSADVKKLNGQYEATINLSNNIDLTAMQMDLNLPVGMTLVDASLSDRASSSHQVAFNRLSNGDYRLLASSPACKAFTGSDGAVLTLTLAGEPSGNGLISNIELATPRAASYEVDDIELNFETTGVENARTTTRIYNEGSNIVIDSPVATTAQIVLANGMTQIVQVTAGKNVFPAPASGMLIVKMGDSIKKLLIK